MARRSKSRSRRDDNSIANFVAGPDLVTVEDFRAWHPEGSFRPPLSSEGRRVRIIGPTYVEEDRPLQPRRVRYNAPKKPMAAPRGQALRVRRGPGGRPLQSKFHSFTVPQKVAVCIRRKIRRQVFHAFGLAGAKRLFRKPRRSWRSQVRC